MENWQTAEPMWYALLKEDAKRMRQYPTEAEAALWTQLRGCQLGKRFLRQHIIYDFIADFYCPEKMLVIEVDGGYHLESEQIQYDEQRTKILESMGLKLIRFTNERVLCDIDNVITEIKRYL